MHLAMNSNIRWILLYCSYMTSPRSLKRWPSAECGTITHVINDAWGAKFNGTTNLLSKLWKWVKRKMGLCNSEAGLTWVPSRTGWVYMAPTRGSKRPSIQFHEGGQYLCSRRSCVTSKEFEKNRPVPFAPLVSNLWCNPQHSIGIKMYP